MHELGICDAKYNGSTFLSSFRCGFGLAEEEGAKVILAACVQSL